MKKTILLLNDDRYYYPAALDRYLSKNKNRISKIFVFPAFIDAKKKKEFEQASMRIMGFSFVTKYVCRTLFLSVLSLLPVPLRWKKHCSIHTVASLHGIPLVNMRSVNSQELTEEIRRENYQVGLSMVSQIYTGEILSLSTFKLYNFHPSLLPRNKGKFPFFWAFYREEKEQGVTCHEITPRIDDGQVVFQKEFKMKDDDTVPSTIARFVEDIPEYMEEALSRIDDARFETPVNGFEAFYGPTPNKEQIAHYHTLVKRSLLDRIKKNYDAPWYPLVMTLITAANIFLLFLPVEAILVGGILFKPKTWARMAFWQTLAATVSTMILALLVLWKGQATLDWLAPHIQQTHSWERSTHMMREWGLWALVVISILPIPILPGIAFAIFSNMSLPSIGVAVFAGRAIKFYGLCFIAAYFPTRFKKKTAISN